MECAVCFDVFGGAQECAPRSQSKAGADRNPPHAEIGQLGKRKLVIESGDEDIDMLGSDCLRLIDRQLRLKRKVAHCSPRLLADRRSRPGSLRLPAALLLPQFRGCARAFHRAEHRHRVFPAKKRILLKWWRVLRIRDVPDRSPFRCPTDLEARNTRTRASRETLQKIVAVNSCLKPILPWLECENGMASDALALQSVFPN